MAYVGCLGTYVPIPMLYFHAARARVPMTPATFCAVGAVWNSAGFDPEASATAFRAADTEDSGSLSESQFLDSQMVHTGFE